MEHEILFSPAKAYAPARIHIRKNGNMRTYDATEAQARRLCNAINNYNHRHASNPSRGFSFIVYADGDWIAEE